MKRRLTVRSPAAPRLMWRRRRWPLLIAALLGAVVWGTVHAWPDTTPSHVAFEPPIGLRTTGPRCWMFTIDESGSMDRSDPRGMRADAVGAATEFLARYGIDGDRVGVTWYADRVHVTAPLEPNDRTATQLGRAAPDVGGGTETAEALEASVASLERGCPVNSQPIVVLVTDGVADQDVLDRTADTLRRIDGTVGVYLIAVNGGGSYDDRAAFWQAPALGIDAYRPINSFDRDDVAWATADLLSLETRQRVAPT